MDIAITTALISGGAALVVAVVGIVANGVAQARATRTAHKNALDLFAVQAGQTAALQQAQLDEQRRIALLDERRSTYLDFQHAMWDYEERINVGDYIRVLWLTPEA